MINYPFELTTHTVYLITTKLMWNSRISTPGAQYACSDIGNMYLGIPLDRPEYMRMVIKLIPQAINNYVCSLTYTMASNRLFWYTNPVTPRTDVGCHEQHYNFIQTQ